MKGQVLYPNRAAAVNGFLRLPRLRLRFKQNSPALRFAKRRDPRTPRKDLHKRLFRLAKATSELTEVAYADHTITFKIKQ